MAVPNIVLSAQWNGGYQEFLSRLDHAIQALPPKGTVPQMGALEAALELDLIRVSAVAQLILRAHG